MPCSIYSEKPQMISCTIIPSKTINHNQERKKKNLQQSNFYQFRSPEGTRRKKNQFEEVNNIQLDTRNKSFYEKELKVKGEKHAITTK